MTHDGAHPIMAPVKTAHRQWIHYRFAFGITALWVIRASTGRLCDAQTLLLLHRIRRGRYLRAHRIHCATGNVPRVCVWRTNIYHGVRASRRVITFEFDRNPDSARRRVIMSGNFDPPSRIGKHVPRPLWRTRIQCVQPAEPGVFWTSSENLCASVCVAHHINGV